MFGALFGALVVRASHGGCVIMTCRSTGPMHWAGHYRNRSAAQRRDPRRQKDDDQVYGEQSAHHGRQSTAREWFSPCTGRQIAFLRMIDSGRNAC